MDVSKTIGVFGGTFDPIHDGHVTAARAALEALDLEKVLFVPAGDPYLKTVNSPVTPARDRYKMVTLALRHEGNPKFEASDIEVFREGPSYTMDTVVELGGCFQEIVLILGMDAVLSLPDWQDPEGLLEKCRVVAVTRPGFESSKVDLLPFQNIADKIEIVVADTPDLSASLIRARLKQQQPIRGICPPVADFIISKDFYI